MRCSCRLRTGSGGSSSSSSGGSAGRSVDCTIPRARSLARKLNLEGGMMTGIERGCTQRRVARRRTGPRAVTSDQTLTSGVQIDCVPFIHEPHGVSTRACPQLSSRILAGLPLLFFISSPPPSLAEETRPSASDRLRVVYSPRCARRSNVGQQVAEKSVVRAGSGVVQPTAASRSSCATFRGVKMEREWKRPLSSRDGKIVDDRETREKNRIDPARTRRGDDVRSARSGGAENKKKVSSRKDTWTGSCSHFRSG